MPKVLAPILIDLLNKTEPGQKTICYMVPLRIIRVTATDENCGTFRVEQLNITSKDAANPKGSWATLSTHSNPIPWGAYKTAFDAAVKAQNDLRNKLQKRMQAQAVQL